MQAWIHDRLFLANQGILSRKETPRRSINYVVTIVINIPYESWARIESLNHAQTHFRPVKIDVPPPN